MANFTTNGNNTVTAEEIAVAVAEGLQHDIKKVATDETHVNIAPAVATLVRAADVVDQINQDAAGCLDRALQVVADSGFNCSECFDEAGKEYEIDNDWKNITTSTLIQVSDTFDKFGFENVANNIDNALKILADM